MNDAEFEGHGRALGETDQRRFGRRCLEAILGFPHQRMQRRHGRGNPRGPVLFGHAGYRKPLPATAAAIKWMRTVREQARGMGKGLLERVGQWQQIGCFRAHTVQQDKQLFERHGFGQQLDTLIRVFGHVLSPMASLMCVQAGGQFIKRVCGPMIASR